MRIDILTIFPEMFGGVINSSISGRAVEKKLIEYYLHNIRDYSENKHKNTDDYPFGGGAGMVMLAQPILDCISEVTAMEKTIPHRIMLTPRGSVLTQKRAIELAKMDRLLLLCGHYEGIDERVMSEIDEEISIGDYVLTGGELPAMVLIDCVSRYISGVLGSDESTNDESFSIGGGILEYPQYTRPATLRNMQVPEVLLNGNHAKINRWRHEQALLKTAKNRPDLLEKVKLSREDARFLEENLNKE